MSAPKTSRKASDALQGAAVPVEETAAPVVVTAPEGDVADVTPATVDKINVDLTKEPETEPETPGVDGPEDDGQEWPEFEVVQAIVIVDQFNYLDDDGAHTSAVKGELVTLDPVAASRGFQIKALRPDN